MQICLPILLTERTRLIQGNLALVQIFFSGQRVFYCPPHEVSYLIWSPDSPYTFPNLCRVICRGRSLDTCCNLWNQHFISTSNRVIPIWGERPDISIDLTKGANMNPTDFLSFPRIKDSIQQLHIPRFWVWQKKVTYPGYRQITSRWYNLASTQIWHPPLFPNINWSSIPYLPYNPFQNDIFGLEDTTPSIWAPWWNDRIKNIPTWKKFSLKHFVN